MNNSSSICNKTSIASGYLLVAKDSNLFLSNTTADIEKLIDLNKKTTKDLFKGLQYIIAASVGTIPALAPVAVQLQAIELQATLEYDNLKEGLE